MEIVVFIFILLKLIAAQNLDGKYSKLNEVLSKKQKISKSVGSNHQDIPVYWINTNNSKRRRVYFSKQLNYLGLLNNHRIEAITPDSKVLYNKNVTSQHKPTAAEISVIASHIVAIHYAIHDQANSKHPYALITEDDVLFKFKVNFTALAESAPSDFTFLQLMISAPTRVLLNYKTLKRYFEKNVTSIYTKKTYWKSWFTTDLSTSTQAYMINKANIKPFIDRLITFDKNRIPLINIINPNPTMFYCPIETTNNPCMLPIPLSADFFLYAGFDLI
jgi:GR25 family glycosyltransferase involved in LPS biosynthesis